MAIKISEVKIIWNVWVMLIADTCGEL